MDDTRIDRLEEEMAHLTKAFEDLSDVVALQEREIKTLSRRVALLLEREAEREVAGGGTATLADAPPPHY